jgi:putative hemolysin
MSSRARSLGWTYPIVPASVPEFHERSGRFAVRFARTPGELAAVQRLRFEVFNLELGEGLDASFATGRDEDRYDEVCHHLLVTLADTDEVIGTYRMMTDDMASRALGFYSGEEFDLRALPADVSRNAIEVGRACISREHRQRQVLFLLWRGLAAYLQHNDKRYVFGCCSLTSQDPDEARRVSAWLDAHDHVRRDVCILPRPGWECGAVAAEAPDPASWTDLELPRLFALYLRYGARVCGPPAIDRQFKTIDWLVLFDREDLAPDSRRMFFG